MSKIVKHCVWIIVGYTGAGKTTLANMLAEKANLKVLSFRDVANPFCEEKGYKNTRDFFKSVPESQFIIEINGCIMCEIGRMFESSSDFIIEGLPSFSVVEKLKSQNAVSTTIIYLEAPPEIRKDRIQQRAVLTSEDAVSEEALKNQFKISLGLGNVIAVADYVIDATRNPNTILKDLLSIVDSQSIKREGFTL